MKKPLIILFSLLPLIVTTSSYAQKWVDMGTKADNGAPMYWSSYDLVETNSGTWKLSDSDTIIGDVIQWSLKNYEASPFDISGNEQYDVVTSVLGSPYRMPSRREFQRLIDNSYVSWGAQKIRDGYTKPYKVNYNDVSWIYGTWQLYSGGFLFKLYISKSRLTWTSLRPGLDAFPHTEYEGSYTIKMDKITFGSYGLFFPISLDKKCIYTPKWEAFQNQHDIVRCPTRIPDKWLDYIELQSKTTGGIIKLPIKKYHSDEGPSMNKTSVSWWTSNKTSNGEIEVLDIIGNDLVLLDKTLGQRYRIRPVYDDGHKYPSKYPNDFGWLQVNVDRFAECQLDIYLDDSLIGNAPYHKELKVRCGSHKVRITGDRIKELEKKVSVGYRETCNYHPSITSKYAKVTIHSSECGIQIDGKQVGSFNWSGELEAGQYKVKVTKACYEPFEETITIVGGRDAYFDITPNRLKKHTLIVSCNADNCKVKIDEQPMSLSSSKPVSLNLEMKNSHTLSIEASGFVPLTHIFYILEDMVVCQNQQELDSYDGELSSVVKSDLEGLEIHLCKLNKRLYYGNDTQYKQRPKYDGPNMGVDRLIIHGISIGSEIGYIGEFYGKSRVMLSWSAGLALRPGDDDASLLFLEETEFKMPVEYYVGLGIGWQIFRGTGLRITPQIGAIGCSLFDELSVTLCAKVNVSYPLTDRFVIGVTPMMNLFKIEELANPYFYWNPSFGISLTLGWQKRK